MAARGSDANHPERGAAGGPADGMSRRGFLSRSLVAGGFVLVAPGILAACAGSSPSTSGGSSTQKPRKGGKATFARVADALSVDPVEVGDNGSIWVVSNLYDRLYQSAPDRCCGMRKVEPLFRALGDYDTWVTGLRREQSKTRANLQPQEPFTLPTGHVLSKLSPLADWTTRDVWQYAEAHNIPLLPLYEKGYTSIGCAPCTSLPFDPNDPRSGRWSGRKLECGIHIQGSH